MSTIQETISLCLTEFSTVLETVMSNLSAKQLCCAASVCSAWRLMASNVKRKRTKVVAKLFRADPDCIDDLDILIQDYLETVIPYPRIAVAYTMDSEYVVFGKMEASKTFNNVIDLLPRDCNFLGCTAGGCVAEMNDSSNVADIETSQNEFGLSLLLVPSIPGVNISTFMIGHSQFKKLSNGGDSSQSDLEDIFGITERRDVKVVVLYVCLSPRSVWKGVKALRKLFPEAILLGGHLSLTQRGRSITHNGISGIIFSGSVTASSVVECEGALKPFTEALDVLAMGYELPPTVAYTTDIVLMVICVGRGTVLYNRSNVESSAVRKKFPNTPIFGMFSYGEIGHNRLRVTTNHPQYKESDNEDYLHTNTTIVCLCRLG